MKNGKNEAEFLIKGERHTLPNLLRSRLLKNPEVVFAAYSMRHPTDKDAKFTVKTRTKSPVSVLNAACKKMAEELEDLEKAFKKALK